MEKGAYKTTYENERSYWWYQARADIVSGVYARKIHSPGMELLNLGCGTGLLSERFGRFGSVAGVDFSSEALEFCAQNRLGSLARADAAALPFRDQCFDACLAFDMVEHVPDDRQAVSEIRRVLKPGGSVLLTVPAFQWMWTRMDEVGKHFRRYTKKQVGELLGQAGLSPVVLTYYNFFLFPLAIAQKLRERAFGGGAGADDFLPALPPLVNRLFYRIFSAEKNWVGRVNFPFGLSVLALAKKIN